MVGTESTALNLLNEQNSEEGKTREKNFIPMEVEIGV